MKRFFQTTTLLGALLLGQQALAQDSTQAPIKDSKQEVSQDNRQKNQFYIPRFSRENILQQLSYQGQRGQSLNYLARNNLKSYNELREFIIDRPLLNTFYEISRDKEPLQLYNGRIDLTFSPSRKKSSPVNGLIRRLIKILKK